MSERRGVSFNADDLRFAVEERDRALREHVAVQRNPNATAEDKAAAEAQLAEANCLYRGIRIAHGTQNIREACRILGATVTK